MSNFQSSGRGGAGNIIDSSKTPKPTPEDLQTPTLKTTLVTTGRGGTGNFAAGLDAEEKRRRQDVEPVIRRDSHGATHIGRGGTGNVVKAGAEEGGDNALAKISSRVSPAPEKSPSPSHAAADKDRQLEKKNSGTAAAAANMAEVGDGENAAGGPAAARKSEEKGWAEKGMSLLFGKK